ncbi:uncharacterized protein LOC116296274, partial [Actinia tenebrosa]|uniref:DNA-directed DNA polymerase n=1 Tax=Actinia tenebrosa TaxID=6105 RepID=A0A6P8I5Y4_ACTTE
MDWLLGPKRDVHALYTFMAHNLKGYDAYPILEECVKRGIKPKCVYQGSKVITMTLEGIAFKDSVCFIPMALRKFPATFGTSGGDKGHFPHFFNTLENAQYEGPFPAPEYYGVDDMDVREKEAFMEWWHEQEGKTFVMKKEIEKYCIQDVMVMARGCLKVRELYVDKFGVDPFAECVTIASTCLTVFKKNFLESEVMGVVPPLGYRQRDIQSVQALEWLHSLGLPELRWAGSTQGEATLQGSKVDGYDRRTNTVYQFHGCFYHGCEVCFRRSQVHAHLGVTMGDLFDKTRERTLELRAAGHHVVEMWSHVWDAEREYHVFTEWIKNLDPIQPREALMGGRTNAVGLYAYCEGEVQVDESDDEAMALMLCSDPVHRIRYVDVVSLYPTVMWEEEYPIGHPMVYLGDDLDLDPEEIADCILDEEWFGLVKCDVDPPRGLFFPVLPRIADHKLMFTLCAACCDEKDVDENEGGECTHTLEERRLRHGVWTTPELKEALNQGYEVAQVHEVWHYPERSSDLFRS